MNPNSFPDRKPRFSLAKRRASELLGQIGDIRAPVPIEKVAALLGASIRYEKFDGQMSGMVLKSQDGTAVIGINLNHSPLRRRFSTAHEIGHLVLHGEDALHVDAATPFAYRTDVSSMGTDAREIEANQFAAELLMPESLVRADVAKLEGVTAEDIVDRMAEDYQVSTQAMTLRLHRLGIIR